MRVSIEVERGSSGAMSRETGVGEEGHREDRVDDGAVNGGAREEDSEERGGMGEGRKEDGMSSWLKPLKSGSARTEALVQPGGRLRSRRDLGLEGTLEAGWRGE